ncbi:MAG TPA: PAS domain-containing protein [Bryobacteraceae bacterium]
MDGRSFFTSARLPVATAVLATGIFIADTVTRLEFAVAVLYVAVVLLSARFCTPSGVAMVAAGCAALTILSYVITRNTGPAIEGFAKALISLGAIAVITPLVLRAQSREHALRRNEAYLAEAQRLTHTGSWAYDPSTGETTYWSEELFRIFSFDPQQRLPANEAFWERIHPDDRDGVNGMIQKALREKAECVLDYRILLPGGMLKHIHSVTHAVVRRSGEVVELVGTAVDVTGRRQAEEALRRSEAHLAEAQRLTHTGSWARNPKGDVYWSEEMFRIWGFDLMQRPPDRDTVLQRVHPEDRDRARENGDKGMRGGTDIDHEYRIVLADGSVRHIHAVGRPFSVRAES